MSGVYFVLLVIGFVCFVLAAFGVGARINLLAVGLACWILVSLLSVGQSVF